jgi:hypothetical protein
MILTSNEIEALGIVQSSVPHGVRSTTYDATVGEIILQGTTLEGDSYVLPPRGMVWVVSKEKFSLPTNITGLATHILDKSARIPSTFLDLKSLSDEVLKTLSGSSLLANRFANVGIFVGFAALLIALIAIFVPIAYGVSEEWMSRKMDIQNIQNELEQIKRGVK